MVAILALRPAKNSLMAAMPYKMKNSRYNTNDVIAKETLFIPRSLTLQHIRYI